MPSWYINTITISLTIKMFLDNIKIKKFLISILSKNILIVKENVIVIFLKRHELLEMLRSINSS